MKKVDVVAAIICDDYKKKTKIFATQRGYGDYKDWWEFPGGKIEEGEAPEQALVREIMEKMNTALKDGGVMYASFKYGDGTKMRGERRFIDFNEESVVPLFENAGFTILHKEIGSDSRPGREDEKWVNVIGKKTK